MNVGPGDIAVVVGTHTCADGVICEVMHIAPNENFELPGGFRAAGAARDGAYWVVKMTQPVLAWTLAGDVVRTPYGTCHDRFLRRIAGPKIAKPESAKQGQSA
jgi:hypothetical protein